MLGLVNSG